MWRETDPNVLAARFRQALLYLGHVSVPRNAVRVDALRCLTIQQVLLRTTPRPTNSRLRINDDIIRRYESFFKQRHQAELHTRGIATGVGHQPRLAQQRRPTELCQPVDRLFLQLWSFMLPAVPFGIRVHVLQPEISRQIHDLYVCWQGCQRGLRRGMRQAAKRAVDLGPIHVDNLDEPRDVRGGQQMGEDIRELHPSLAVACQGGHLKMRVESQQTDDFRTSVARRTEDGDVLLV
mmetsp:Transcript_1717/g.5729  ORF Transcript_1717/g.5729 Transcript_1717/m.5729 type:complete len:236 (+) Transcript_1717:572-1279(+)